ncbi:MAG TPA: hypothetical protein DF383_12310 [Deltaproteobacteria bacterium]|nr:hypothetical protein [Deltaproteobacteria bacterium]
MLSLIALLLPGAGFALGLCRLRSDPRFAWLHSLRQWPWELWLIAGAGFLATLGGIADWAYHRWSGVPIGSRERFYELMALVFGGLPLFVLMAMASVSPHPGNFLLPVLVVLLFTASLICFDEFVFHRRRCRRLETLMHRFLVFGYAVAWLAWAHWCFVRPLALAKEILL